MSQDPQQNIIIYQSEDGKISVSIDIYLSTGS